MPGKGGRSLFGYEGAQRDVDIDSLSISSESFLVFYIARIFLED
jgi:hypothetical protein